MRVFEGLVEKKDKLVVIGLGYVGMPLAVEFATKLNVIGFDINKEKIANYKNGIDPTSELTPEDLATTNIEFSSLEACISECSFIIVAVPTPVNADHTPDLTSVIEASKIVGRNIKPGTIVVYESTVFPGCTEDTCIPIIESESGMKCGLDFFVGYSPERINPGDKKHTLRNITKIVSGFDEETLLEIKNVYDLIIDAGTYPVSNIKTAEAIKVVENSQRDINIAFMNELAMVFDKMGIDTNEVVDGMNTKWNALGFRPGLVGGHCIAVDPYYFTFQAQRLGYHSQIILNGRKVNDGMGEYIAEKVLSEMVSAGKQIVDSRVLILGVTFKENCPDARCTKVVDIVNKLKEYGMVPIVVDPVADKSMVSDEYGIGIQDIGDVEDVDCVVVAVAHNEFRKLGLSEILKLYKPDEQKVLLDIKGIFSVSELKKSGIRFWRL